MNSLGKKILDLMGGENNIIKLTYCATRLRPTFKSYDLVKVDEIKKLDGVVGVVDDKNRFQIIIGTNVESIYNQIIDNSNINSEKKVDILIEDDLKLEESKQGILDRFISFVVSVFRPLLPLFAGSGLIRGFTILAIELGILERGSTTDIILTSAATSVFSILSILVAMSTAKQLKCSMPIAAAIMAAVSMPGFLNLMNGNPGTVVSLFGLPVPVFEYSGQVIPPILLVFAQSKIENKLKKVLPSSLHLVAIPTILIITMIPLLTVVIGPVGNYISIGIAKFVELITSWNNIITGAIVGGIWNILIMFGVHWAPNTTVIIPQISTTGSSPLIAYGATANFGMAGAAFAIFLKSKDKKLKNFSVSSIMSVFLSGIVEPAIYGLGVPFKTPLIAGCLGAAMGGAFMGAFNVVGYAFVFGGLTTIPAFAGPTLWAYCVGLAIAFFGGMILTLLLGWKEENKVKGEIDE